MCASVSSPSPSQSSDNVENCPFCALHLEDNMELNTHIEVHLSKPKTAARKPNCFPATLDNKTSENELLCPICSMQFSDIEVLNGHVNAHFSAPPTPSAYSPCLACPVCTMEFLENEQLRVHVNGHFSVPQTPVNTVDQLLVENIEQQEKEDQAEKEKKDFDKLQRQYGMDDKGSFKGQNKIDMQKAVCKGEITVRDYYNRLANIHQSEAAGIDDGHSCTIGVLEQVKEFYARSAFNVSYVWLCSSVNHYATSYGDKGWGCGYRNLQMLLSSLVKNSVYKTVLFEGESEIPSISKIQQLIEQAWRNGFDVQGSEQLGGSIFMSKKWIGATEIVATLSSMKVKCQLLDFHHPTGPNGTHPLLFSWVHDYFNQPANFKPPLYLQHQGHSQTIFGIEEFKDSTKKLLIYDPSTTKKQMQQFHTNIDANLMRTIRRPLTSMKAKQYQIVAVVGTLTESQQDKSKALKSDRIP